MRKAIKIERSMQQQSDSEHELAKLLVETLNLEGVDPADIHPEEALFNEGLGLDSIDALELALAISQKHEIQLKADNEDMQRAFGTLRTLNAYIKEHST
jgi:acyl carrier protein